MSDLETRAGRQLYGLLPEVYRSRDDGSLSSWMDAMGHLLDLVRNTLEQRLADSFPDQPLRGRASQDWLLPYFAELLEPHLVSSDPRGQRSEVANAITWRQRKGTLAVAEQIAQEVGQIEIEVQEGWRRVATTPRIGWSTPVAPPAAGQPHASEVPAGTVAFGLQSRAFRTGADDPAGHTTRFGGQWHSWKQAYAGGTPTFPGSYEDVSARTADLRAPDGRRGHAHPRRLLLFYPPPSGFFPPGAPQVAWWNHLRPIFLGFDTYSDDLEASGQNSFPFVIDGQPCSLEWAPHAQGLPRILMKKSNVLVAERLVEPDGREVIRCFVGNDRSVERIRKAGEDTVFRSADGLPLIITENPTLPAGITSRIEGLSFLGQMTVPAGSRVKLRNAAVKEIYAYTQDLQEPVIDAVDSLIDTCNASSGLIRLEYTTVLGSLYGARLQVSDSLVAGTMYQAGTTGDPGAFRYSRLPAIPAGPRVLAAFNTKEAPLFMELDFQENGKIVRRPARFGEYGAGVLHPETPRSIRFGAEDGGEMGAYHGRRYSSAAEAVRGKLEDYLPVGLQAVLIPDPRLLSAPPELEE